MGAPSMHRTTPRHTVVLVLMTMVLGWSSVSAQKFYPDDPLVREPAPVPAVDPGVRNLSLLLETVSGTLGRPGERHPRGGVIEAQGVNTLGEVMDGPWFVNRHSRTRMGLDALRRGAGDSRPPSMSEPWLVMLIRAQGVRPSMLIRDASGQVYLLLFDSKEAPELATGAELISSRFFYALGYHVPESYLTVFGREYLVPDTNASDVTSFGRFRPLAQEDIDDFLEPVARRSDGRYRAVALRIPPEISSLIGPFQFFGTRTDDPNDVVPHEHRRDLRGLYVFSAWLNHTRVGPLYTADAVVTPDGEPPHIRHYLVDFTSTLGSGRDTAKAAWEGRDPLIGKSDSIRNIFGLGIYTHDWMRASYPDLPAVGRFESDTFQPDEWRTPYSLAPFDNRLPDDTFWAAKQVMAFSDEDIRAIVQVAQYSDQRATDWIADRLIERRDGIGRLYFGRVLPLDGFQVRDGTLAFEDLGALHGLSAPRTYSVEWSVFDNGTGAASAHIGDARADAVVPPVAMSSANGSYFQARLTAAGVDPGTAVRVVLRKEQDGLRVVGIDHEWPGRTLVDPRVINRPVRNRHAELDPERKKLFDAFAQRLNAATGQTLSPNEQFRAMTPSEQTTFDAITHALLRSPLTDAEGRSLGRALDLVVDVNRVAGQYAGRGGDQQFRLYVDLRPDARDVLERSREFVRSHENTVYHPGFPHSYRLGEGVPSVQFSLAEDGRSADIDVDYRASKAPQSLFNGHLTASNSDVRAGDNAQRHDRRWSGFAAWWADVFGNVRFPDHPEAAGGPFGAAPLRTPVALPPDRPTGAPIPDVADAAQEFFTDWLVRRNYPAALAFLAPDALACVADSVDARPGASQAELRQAALQLLEKTATTWGPKANLSEAMNPVLPWSKDLHVMRHAFQQDFAMLEVPDELGAQYECGAVPPATFTASVQPRYGTYYGALLQVVREGQPGGTIAFVWRRVAGEWRLVSYRAID